MIETVIAFGILQGLSVDAMLLKKPLPMAKAVKAGKSSTAEQEVTLLLIARGGDCFCPDMLCRKAARLRTATAL